MKLRYFTLFSLFCAFYGCSSSTTVNPYAFDFTQINNEYLKNVSEIDGVNTITSGSWSGKDISWKDSTGKLDSLASFPGKVVILSFWNTSPDTSFDEEPTLDSVQANWGDSVVIVSVASYNSTVSFNTIDSFVVAHNFRHQIVIDSAQRAQVQYVGSNGLGYPETVILKPNGNILNGQYEAGWASLGLLDTLVGLAYK